VILPLTEPSLFSTGNLRRPTSGILLFGPPGTGKTMLAKAVARESRATFLNITMSSITSKWYGDGEKFTAAIFSLAKKLSPCIIFIDEIDSFLSSRTGGEHEASRRIKNEFMTLWDGLKTSEGERITVMGATNRPGDLDDAVLRRMPRRLLVDLPDIVAREKILRILLAQEQLEPNVDVKELSKLTEGYTGSDLKNLCVAAAYQIVNEFMQYKEQEQNGLKVMKLSKEFIRPLTLIDFHKAKTDIKRTVVDQAFSFQELKKWNELYGEGSGQGGISPVGF